jgi:ABC-type multidrug transport system ATPase subunit
VNEVVVEVDSLSKSFGAVRAVDVVSCAVEEGEIFGIIGPDGAGKTTLLRMLASLLLPNAGSARLEGFDVVANFREIRRRVGYMPGRVSLYGDLSVAENLSFFAAIFGTTVKANRALIDPLYRFLEPFADRRASALSGGMKQKLALCCALIHRPRVLLLDEPTTGVDAVSRRELWEMLGSLREQGITILVSTPYMDEAARCDRVALMSGGRFLAVAPPVQLAEQFGYPLFEIRPAVGDSRLALARALDALPETRSAAVFGEVVHHADLRRDLEPTALAAMLAERGFAAAAVRRIVPGIEDVFIDLARDRDHA